MHFNQRKGTLWIRNIQITGRYNYSAFGSSLVPIYWLGSYILIFLPSSLCTQPCQKLCSCSFQHWKPKLLFCHYFQGLLYTLIYQCIIMYDIIFKTSETPFLDSTKIFQCLWLLSNNFFFALLNVSFFG